MSVESVAFWSALAVYAVAAAAYILGFATGRDGAVRWALRLAYGGFALHTVSIVARFVASGRLPISQDYENALAGGWTIMAAFLLLGLLRPRARVAGALVLPIVIVTLGFGATSPSAITPLTPAYRSGWLAVHVTFAWITYACYSCTAGLAAAVLLRKRGPLPERIEALLPSPEEIDEVSVRLVGIGFLANAVMIVTGAIWGYRLWGSYWSWDPVETWSLITWLAFGLYLHLRLTLGWSGSRLAWVALAGLVGVLMAFWGVQFAPSTFHLFREIGRSGRPGG